MQEASKNQAGSNGVQEMRRGVCGGASPSMVLRGLFAHLYLSCFARAEVKPRMVDFCLDCNNTLLIVG